MPIMVSQPGVGLAAGSCFVAPLVLFPESEAAELSDDCIVPDSESSDALLCVPDVPESCEKAALFPEKPLKELAEEFA